MASVGLGYYSFGETLASATDAANTYVTVSGGSIGVKGFGGPTMGNVYGGGSGSKTIVRCGLILGNTICQHQPTFGETYRDLS